MRGDKMDYPDRKSGRRRDNSHCQRAAHKLEVISNNGLSIAVNEFRHLAYIMQQSSRRRGTAAGVIVLQP